MLPDGRYLLQVPYNNATELTRDVLRFGSDVVVRGPEALQETVRTALATALAQYGE